MASQQDTDIRYMKAALDEAHKAALSGEVPIGAVIVSPRGVIIGRGHNLTETLHDVTAHAEMLAITAATQSLGGKYLTGCTLYVTVEPCVMCAGAIGWTQLGRIVWGADDPKRGHRVFVGRSPFHPRATITTGVLADEATALLRNFFSVLRH